MYTSALTYRVSFITSVIFIASFGIFMTVMIVRFINQDAEFIGMGYSQEFGE